MTKFPREFADLLSPKGKAILARGYADSKRIFHGRVTPLALLRGVLDEKKSTACRRLLDKAMYDYVRRVEAPIPRESITGMKKNYGELLPKTMRFKTAYFSSRSSLSYRAAVEIGLLEMMKSGSFAAFAEAVTGLVLEKQPGVQVILYEEGDYAGPHNDHHPESENAQRGFVDIHVSLTNASVFGQQLVYEERSHFSRTYSVSENGTVAVYRLPFWHYTTPLQAKRLREQDARRWLLLGTFDINREILNGSSRALRQRKTRGDSSQS